MIPEEREMYDDIHAAIATCRHSLIDGALVERAKAVQALLPSVSEGGMADTSLMKKSVPMNPNYPRLSVQDMTLFMSLTISNLLWGLTGEYIVLLKMTWFRFLSGMRRYFMNAT